MRTVASRAVVRRHRAFFVLGRGGEIAEPDNTIPGRPAEPEYSISRCVKHGGIAKAEIQDNATRRIVASVPLLPRNADPDSGAANLRDLVRSAAVFNNTILYDTMLQDYCRRLCATGSGGDVLYERLAGKELLINHSPLVKTTLGLN